MVSTWCGNMNRKTMNRLEHAGFRVRQALFAVCLALFFILPGLAGCDDPEPPGVDLDMARQAYSRGHFSEAEKIYEQYLQDEPEGADRWEAWNRLLDVSMNVRIDPERAEALLDAMFLEFSEDSERAWSLLQKQAELHESLQEWEKAIESWQRALSSGDLSPEHRADVYLRLAKIHQQGREYDLAQEALTACLREDVDPEMLASCKFELAQTLGYMKRWNRTKTLLQEIMDDPEVGEERKALATFMLADIYETDGDKKKAKALLESILTTYPNPKVVETRLENLKKRK